jgi:hypothetical protein
MRARAAAMRWLPRYFARGLMASRGSHRCICRVAHFTYGRATALRAQTFQQIIKGKSRPGRRRGAPAVEHRPYGHHADRRLRRCGRPGASRSPEPSCPHLLPHTPSEAVAWPSLTAPAAVRCALQAVRPATGGFQTPCMRTARTSSTASSTSRCAASLSMHALSTP